MRMWLNAVYAIIYHLIYYLIDLLAQLGKLYSTEWSSPTEERADKLDMKRLWKTINNLKVQNLSINLLPIRTWTTMRMKYILKIQYCSKCILQNGILPRQIFSLLTSNLICLRMPCLTINLLKFQNYFYKMANYLHKTQGRRP